jgi:hypothetical protein
MFPLRRFLFQRWKSSRSRVSIKTNPRLRPHLHGVPWTAKGWRVGQIKLTHDVNGHLIKNRRCRDVDALRDFGVSMAEKLNS